MSISKVLSAFRTSTLLWAFNKLRSVLLLNRSSGGKEPFVARCVFFFPPSSLSWEFLCLNFVFVSSQRPDHVVCVWESVISELRRLVSWCLFNFPVQLIAEGTFSLALCAWLKGQKRSACLNRRRVISDCKSGSLMRRLHVVPIPNVISFFSPCSLPWRLLRLNFVFITNQNRSTLFVG
jgi:hypothetical protein